MIPLKPSGKIDLEHRAFFLRGSRGNPVFIAASEDGYVSLVDPESQTVRSHRPATKLRGVFPHPTEPLIAFVDGKTGLLVVQNLAEKKVTEVEPPRITTGSSRLISKGFANCYFEESGNFLWLVAPVSDDRGEVALVETKSWSVIQRAIVEDQFSASSYSFHDTGRAGLICLWIAAGQDGQQIYWLKRKGVSFSLAKVDELTNCVPPVFSEDGSEFLIVSEDNSISRHSFPSMKQLGSALESADEDNPFAESLCYLNDGHALSSTPEGRLFLLDTKKMRIEDEVALEGHEPRPIGEYFPTLAKESGLATDITYFERLANFIIFVYRRDRGTGLKGWKDSLLWYSANS